jgi:hypothetical protein
VDQRGAAAPKLFVIALRCGQLGNRLILFAHFIALAEESGCRVVNISFHSYAHLFEHTAQDIYCRYPVAARRSWLDAVPGLARAIRKTRILYHVVRYGSALNARLPLLGKSVLTVEEMPEITLIEGAEFQGRIRDARLVLIYGWPFRAPGCVARHADKIRAYFRPVPEHARASREAVERLRRGADVVAGVHIRHGDYRHYRGGQFNFPVARYAAWMRELAGQFPGRKVSFLVCSDEPRNAAEFPGLAVGFGPGTPVGDLYALAGCDCLFGPRSTFTQWASFYGNTPLRPISSSEDRLDRATFRVSGLEG